MHQHREDLQLQDNGAGVSPFAHGPLAQPELWLQFSRKFDTPAGRAYARLDASHNEWQPDTWPTGRWLALAPLTLDPRSLTFTDNASILAMCVTCYATVTTGKPLHVAPANHLRPIPEALQGLTIAEEKLISRVRVHVNVIKLTGGRIRSDPATAQSGLRGHCICFPQDLTAALDVLPMDPQFLAEDIKVVFIGSRRPDCDKMRLMFVRRQKIATALAWLQLNNPWYADITICPLLLSSLPENDVPDALWDTLTF